MVLSAFWTSIDISRLWENFDLDMSILDRNAGSSISEKSAIAVDQEALTSLSRLLILDIVC